jgi:diadenosine tetraphosphate (Ap4A) HIT family hydrolase
VNYYTHGLIPYAHVHILPRFEEMSEDVPIIPKTDKPNQDEFEAVALKIREAQV